MPAGPPEPVETSGSNVLLFGGTFDPVTRAHRRVASAAQEVVGGDLVIVPVGRNPHKETGPVTGDTDRVAMLELAFGEGAHIWTDEIDRANAGEPSYWYRTLERFADAWLPSTKPDSETGSVRFLIGADQAQSLHRWSEPERILELAWPVIVPRPPIESAADVRSVMQSSGAWSADQLRRFGGAVVSIEPIADSATAVRAALARGDTKTAGSLLDPAVLDYIEQKKLYRG